MDAFVTKFFPQYSGPGASFPECDNLKFHTFLSGYMKVDDQHSVQTTRVKISQPMTAAGQLEGTFEGLSSSNDGINKHFLTPEGILNMQIVADSLKQSTDVWRMYCWEWADNHVALIFNMLRLTFLLKLQAMNGGSLNTKLGVLNDGTVEVDLDKAWPEEYQELACMNTWPCGNNKDLHPKADRLTTMIPSDGRNALDLRGLNQQECIVVLMMLGGWVRRSRARLDFDLVVLTKDIYYRADTDISAYSDWVEGVPATQCPPLPIVEVVWSALRKYVANNRVYHHFSTALYLLTFCTYQFLPPVPEAAVWMGFKWKVNLPGFASIQGRYDLFLNGEAAIVSHRALGEWGFFNKNMEKINLACLLVAQAFQTGCAVRALRRSFEVDPADLDKTMGDFYHPNKFSSAAVAEAIRGSFPIPGMLGAEYTGGPIFDDAGTFEVELTELPAGDDINYRTTTRDMSTKTIRKVSKALVDLGKDHVEYAVKQALITWLKIKAARLRRNKETEAEISEEMTAAEEDNYLVEEEDVEKAEKYFIVCKWVPLPGVPVLLLPINPFPYATPFQLQGTVSPDLGEFTCQGFKVLLPEGWLAAAMYAQCGQRLKYNAAGDLSGCLTYRSPTGMNFTWPVMSDPKFQNIGISFDDTEEDFDAKISLPPPTGVAFKGYKLVYSTMIHRKGISDTYHQRVRDIEECGTR